MKRYMLLRFNVLLACLSLVAVPLFADASVPGSRMFSERKKETVSRMDFAARFMHEIGEDNKDVEYITVGPEMMQKVEEYMNENKADDNGASAVIPHVKSVRLVRVATGGDKYHEKASGLLHKNTNRYVFSVGDTLMTDGGGIQMWTRRRGRTIVELVVLTLSADGRFELIDLTGIMDEEILKNLTKMHL